MLCCLRETHLSLKGSTALERKDAQKLQSEGTRSQAGTNILIADKIDFKLKPT